MLMTNHVSLVAGLLAGFAVAVPIGPMGLLCIQRTLAAGMAVGVSTGLGAATVNIAYAALVLLGLDAFAPWMAGGGRALGALGGLFLLWSASRALRSRQLTDGLTRPTAPPALAAYGSAVVFNAGNPMALILIIAVISPLVGHPASSCASELLFLLGMFSAAATWWVCLSAAVALLRSRLSPTVLAYVNQAAGLMLTLYGLLALLRSTRM
jgi:threonine/homoserine/homoserine lactone efflux protein